MHDVETVVFREENFNGKRDIDEVITLDFTYCFVLRDLLPLRFVAKPGCKKFMGTHIRKNRWPNYGEESSGEMEHDGSQ